VIRSSHCRYVELALRESGLCQAPFGVSTVEDRMYICTLRMHHYGHGDVAHLEVETKFSARAVRAGSLFSRPQ
jgi:hypothetical protein